ncbi:MAG: DnaJ domain-containing protein [Sphingomonas sp.]
MAKLFFAALVIAVVWMLLRKPGHRMPMPEAEARAVLGVDEHAGEDAIRAAHRRLVSAVHPDRGGSEELTRRINAARDVLLKKLR